MFWKEDAPCPSPARTSRASGTSSRSGWSPVKRGYRQISWPFICTTSTISQWLHGGELIFISGAGLDCGEESLLSLMRESVSKGLAGMVMLIGERYIPEIPPSLVELADASCFPLFEMPWDVKLIDVTQEISENIMNRKE